MNDFRVVEGSKTHADILYLKHLLQAPDELTAIETAIRLQAELSRLLDTHIQVRLWGGPPFDSFRWFGAVKPEAPCREEPRNG